MKRLTLKYLSFLFLVRKKMIILVISIIRYDTYICNEPSLRLYQSVYLFLFVIVPTVTIVVEGGRDTIINMYYDLQNDIPVVIIDVS